MARGFQRTDIERPAGPELHRRGQDELEDRIATGRPAGRARPSSGRARRAAGMVRPAATMSRRRRSARCRAPAASRSVRASPAACASTARSAVAAASTRATYPAASTAAASWGIPVLVRSNRTVADSAARLTCASSTPSTFERKRVIRLTHAAQVMPSTGNDTVWRRGDDAVMAVEGYSPGVSGTTGIRAGTRPDTGRIGVDMALADRRSAARR